MGRSEYTKAYPLVRPVDELTGSAGFESSEKFGRPLVRRLGRDQIINDLAERGVAIIVVSSELPELIGLCDRVVVIREGRISGELRRDQLDEKALIGLAMGVN